MADCLAVRRLASSRISLRSLPLRWFSALLLLAFAVPALHAGDLADVRARGKLILISYPLLDGTFMGVDVEAMQRKEKTLKELKDIAAFRGIDVEIIKGFAASLGVKVEVHPVTKGYDALLPALLTREGDLVASSFSITPQRLESADFSAPYITGWVAIAVRPDSSIASLEDLRGKRVAVMHGSSQLEKVQALDLELRLQLNDFALENYVAVTEGKADFTLMDSYAQVGEPVSPTYPGLKTALRISEFSYGIAARKGSDLLAPLNAYLAKIRSSGELQALITKYQAEATQVKVAAP